MPQPARQRPAYDVDNAGRRLLEVIVFTLCGMGAGLMFLVHGVAAVVAFVDGDAAAGAWTWRALAWGFAAALCGGLDERATTKT